MQFFYLLLVHLGCISYLEAKLEGNIIDGFLALSDTDDSINERLLDSSQPLESVIVSVVSDDSEISLNLHGYRGFNIPLEDYTYISKISGKPPTIVSGLTHSNSTQILLTNKYTIDPTKCVCPNGDLEVSNTKDCNCCLPGACKCPGSNICVPCGNVDPDCLEDYINFTDSKSAVSIPYGPVNQTVIFRAIGNTLQIYYLVKLKDYYYLTEGKEILKIESKIAAVRYGETYSYNGSKLIKRKFLILLTDHSTDHIFYEWFQNPSTEGLGRELPWLTEKSVPSKDFEVFQSGGWIMVGYSVEGTLHMSVLKDYSDGMFKIVPLQSIHLPNLVSWSYHSGNGQNIIALFGSHYTTLYEMDSDYKAFDIIVYGEKHGDPMQVLLLKVEDKLLLVLVWSCAVEIYTIQNDGTTEKVEVLRYPACPLVSASMYEFKDASYIILKSKASDHFQVVQLTVKQEFVKKYRSKNSKIMDKIKREYEYQMALLDNIEKKLKSQLNELKGSEFSKSPFNKQIFDNRMDDDLSKPYIQLAEIDNIAKKIEHHLLNAEHRLSDIVYNDTTLRMIEGDKDVRKVIVKDMTAKNAYIDISKDRTEAIEDTLQKLVTIDDRRIIKGDKFLNGNIKIDNLRTNFINEIDVNKIVKGDRNFEIEGATFSSGLHIKNDLELKDGRTIFGADLSTEAIGLQDTAELGKCSFTNLKALDGIQIIEKRINKDHLDDLMLNFGKRGEVLVYPKSAYFANLTLLGNLEAPTIMTTKVNVLLENVINLEANEYLKKVSFDKVVVKNVSATYINEEVFPRDFINTRSTIVDLGDKSFNKIVFGDLSVAGSINGVKTDSVVSQSNPQVITGTKTFKNGIKVFGNLDIESSKIDGVDITYPTYESHSHLSGKTRTIKSEIRISELLIKGSLNHGNLFSTINDLAYITNGTLALGGKKKFNSLVVGNGAINGKIGYLSLPLFVNTKTENQINGKKLFVNDLSFTNVVVRNTVDDTNLTELFSNALYSNKRNQIIHGLKTVDSMSCKVINVTRSVNGILANEFLMKTGYHFGQGVYTFANVVFHHLTAKKISLPEYSEISGIPVSKINEEVAIKSFSPTLTVTGKLTVKDGFNANTINNEKVYRLFHLLEDNKLNVLSGKMHYDYLTVDGPLTSDHLISNVNVSKLLSSTVKLFGRNSIGESSWEEIVVPSLKVDRFVNNINFASLADDVVFADDNFTYFRGEKTFVNGCIVKGGLEAKLINSIELSKKILLKNVPQIITAPYIFQDIKAQDTKIGFFNNRSLRNLSNIDIPRIEMRASETFFGHVNSRSIEVDGLVDGLDLKAIMKDSVRINASKIVMSGRKHFLQPPAFSKLHITHLNGNYIDYDSLRNKSLVTKIKKLNVVGRLKANSIKAVSTFVDGELQKIMDHLATGVKLITDPDEHLLLSDVHVMGDLAVSKFNELNIEQSLLLKKAPQIFYVNDMYFGKGVFQNLTVLGSINDIQMAEVQISKDVITKTFKDSIQFSEDLIIEGRVHAGYLGYRLLKVPDDLVQTTIPQTLTGPLHFLQPIQTKTVSTSSVRTILNHRDISPHGFPGIHKDYFDLGNYNLTSKKLRNSLEKSLEQECNKMKNFENLLNRSLVIPHGLRMISVSTFLQQNETTLEEKRQIGEVNHLPIKITSAFKAFGIVWIIRATPSDFCSAKVYKYDSEGHLEYHYTLINTGKIVQFVVLTENDLSVTVLFVSSGEMVCGGRGSSLWRAKRPDMKLKRLGEDKYPPADMATIEETNEHINVYFKSNYGENIYIYQYRNGMLTRGEQTDKFLNISRTTLSSDGSLASVKLWDDFKMVFEDLNGRTQSFIYVIVDDIRLVAHQNQLMLLTSTTSRDLYEPKSAVYFSKYREDLIKVVDRIDLDRPAKLFPFRIILSNEEYNFFILLQEYSTPKFYSVKGMSNPKVWQELDIQLQSHVWAEILQGPDLDQARILIGDLTKSYLMEVQLNGISYNGDTFTCHLLEY